MGNIKKTKKQNKENINGSRFKKICDQCPNENNIENMGKTHEENQNEPVILHSLKGETLYVYIFWKMPSSRNHSSQMADN